MAELCLLSEQTYFYSSPSWLLGDHLGSTSMVADAGGTVVNELRYSAFGEIRYQNGTLTTDYLYTGQRQEAEIGLYYYVARWYDPAIGRFIQADSIVPNPLSVKGFDRYSYSYNSPLNYLDPSGHRPILLDGEQFAETDQSLGITNHVSTTYRPNANNTNNWKPPSENNKKVNFPNKNYNHEKEETSDPLLEELVNHTNSEQEDYYTDAQLYGLAATGFVAEVGLAFAEISLVVLQVELASIGGPLGVIFDVAVILPMEVLIMDVGIGIAKYIYEAAETKQKPEFELTIYPIIFSNLMANDDRQ